MEKFIEKNYKKIILIICILGILLRAIYIIENPIRKNQYDWIHVHTPIAGLYGRLLKVSFPQLRTIYTAHGFHFHQGGSKVGWLVYYPIERLMASFTQFSMSILPFLSFIFLSKPL